MKLGFLYAGQGSQKPEMGLDFYREDPSARKFYDSLPDGHLIKDLSFYSNEETLRQTENTQVVLVAFQTMITDLLTEKGMVPNALCGLSIGEYAALYTSGVLSKEDVISISRLRGEAMKNAVKGIHTSMIAVLKSNEEEIQKILDEINTKNVFAEISNINSPDQIVVAGAESVIEMLTRRLKEKRIRSIPLKVSGPFHTSYMNPAATTLKELFQKIPFQRERIPIYYNLTGNTSPLIDIKHTMVEQVRQKVRLADDLKNMIEDGVDAFIEIGHQNVFKKILKKMAPKIPVYTIAKYEDYKNVLGRFHG
ncbi:MAG: ACP S-malonyltransferase [Tissierellia bacterium]|nr:ACP S-malonyltransferase [Tissierellia bacterium]